MFRPFSFQMMTADKTRLPNVLYAQDKKNIFLTIDLQDIQEKHNIKTTDQTIQFDAEKEGIHYGFQIDLFDKVKQDSWCFHPTNRHIEIIVAKENSEAAFWPRLNKTGKLSFVKTDFSKWKDEDEDEEEMPANATNFQDQMNEQMMMQMLSQQNSMNNGGAMNFEEVDSDDEEEPVAEVQ
jgi:prostaglandin-E synthase